jgi:4-hydroxythreonine-4-phosphate dehydrogenase
MTNSSIFEGPLVPDTAFTPHNRERFKYFIAMYHDQGLIPLKTLYFDKSINITINIPTIRTSPDHGTAFDIAYKNKNPSIISYINAIKYCLK